MDARTQVERDARVTRALMKLSSARREKLDKLDFETYVEGLREFSADVVDVVCGDFARIAPEEYQPRFPPLSAIREGCIRRVQATETKRKALSAPALDAQYPPLSEEKWAEIRARFEEVLGRRTMPSARPADDTEHSA
jgi:hypothetical protein